MEAEAHGLKVITSSHVACHTCGCTCGGGRVNPTGSSLNEVSQHISQQLGDSADDSDLECLGESNPGSFQLIINHPEDQYETKDVFKEEKKLVSVKTHKRKVQALLKQLPSVSCNNKMQPGLWKPDEIERLIEAYTKYGNNWIKVQKHVKTRTKTACTNKMLKIDPMSTKCSYEWKPTEDESLVAIKNENPQMSWLEVHQKFFPKISASEIETRYYKLIGVSHSQKRLSELKLFKLISMRQLGKSNDDICRAFYNKPIQELEKCISDKITPYVQEYRRGVPQKVGEADTQSIDDICKNFLNRPTSVEDDDSDPTQQEITKLLPILIEDFQSRHKLTAEEICEQDLCSYEPYKVQDKA